MLGCFLKLYCTIPLLFCSLNKKINHILYCTWLYLCEVGMTAVLPADIHDSCVTPLDHAGRSLLPNTAESLKLKQMEL